MTYMYIYVVFLLQDARRKHITEQYKKLYNVERIGLDQPWAKCGLFAAVALRLIFCGLIAAFCPKNFAIMVCNILVI